MYFIFIYIGQFILYYWPASVSRDLDTTCWQNGDISLLYLYIKYKCMSTVRWILPSETPSISIKVSSEYTDRCKISDFLFSEFHTNINYYK